MVNITRLEKVIEKTRKTVESSREELYQLGEAARRDYERTKHELALTRNDIAEIIKEVDTLEIEYNKSRVHLMEVSRNFDQYNEEQIKNAYDKAHQKQLDLLSKREKEKMLRLHRDYLERSLKTLEITIRRSEELISNIGMALKILCNDLQNASIQIGEMQQMQALGLSVIMAQEEERKRVAREIHDGPAQSLANIVMRAEFCLKLMEMNPALLEDELYGLMDLVRTSLQDVRKIIFDLRPMSLDDLGLVPALKRYAEQYTKDYGIFVEITIMGQEYELAGSLVIAIFRVIQESMTNVRKYANATEIVIKIEYLPKKINVVVRDNGCGFGIEKVMAEKNGVAFGIVGMRERIQLLKGKFEIRSALGRGTEVILSVPTTKIDNILPGSEVIKLSDIKKDRVKVIIVDDHPLIREGIIKILSLEPSIEVVGEAEDGAQAIELARTTDVDMILMDINMPNMNGIMATKIIKQEKPDVNIIALTIHNQEEYLFELIRCGISGYVKDVRPGELIETIQKVAQGQGFIPPSLTPKSFEELSRLSKNKEQTEDTFNLTAREQEVLQEMAQGLSNKEIGEKLFITEKTVKNHLTNIFQKLGVSDRTQALLFAIKHNMVII